MSSSPRSSTALSPVSDTTPFRFNPYKAEFAADPYPTYRRLRAEFPFYKTPGFMGNELFLTCFRDVRSVLSDARLQVDTLPQRIQKKSEYLEPSDNLDDLSQTISQWLFFLNPPDHTKLRGLVSQAFSAGAIAKMHVFVQRTIQDLVEPIETGQIVDIMPTIAYPLPALLTAYILGIPKEDCGYLTRWSRTLFWVFDQPISLEKYAKLNQVAAEFTAYFRDILRQRQQTPQDDLLSHLATAINDDDQLTEEDILSFCAMIFSVGQETTGSAFGSSLLSLLQHPEQWALLQREPTLL